MLKLAGRVPRKGNSLVAGNEINRHWLGSDERRKTVCLTLRSHVVQFTRLLLF